MKIALIVPGGVDRSGTHQVIPALLWLIERLAKAGDEVHVFALQQEPRPGRWGLLGATIHNAGARPRRLRALRQMLAEHRRGRFDVVHAFWAAGPGLVAAAFRMLTRVPAVVTLPGGDLSALGDIGYGARLTRRGRMLVRMALSGASVVAAPSEWMRAKAETLGFAAIRLPYGVALDRWPVRAPGPRQPGAPLRLIHIANLNRVKDQPVLLEALRQLADCGVAFHLDVIGLDTLAGEIQRRCAALGLGEHVAFHGLLPHHAVRPWIERADILVMSSQHEGVPIVVLEAAVAGVPTVGTAVGTIADWAPDAAVAVPVGNAAALAREIGRIAADETERLRLAQAAQVRAVAEDADAAAGMMRDLYARLKRGETSTSAPSLNLPPQPRK